MLNIGIYLFLRLTGSLTRDYIDALKAVLSVVCVLTSSDSWYALHLPHGHAVTATAVGQRGVLSYSARREKNGSLSKH